MIYETLKVVTSKELFLNIRIRVETEFNVSIDVEYIKHYILALLGASVNVRPGYEFAVLFKLNDIIEHMDKSSNEALLVLKVLKKMQEKDNHIILMFGS